MIRRAIGLRVGERPSPLGEAVGGRSLVIIGKLRLELSFASTASIFARSDTGMNDALLRICFRRDLLIQATGLLDVVGCDNTARPQSRALQLV